MCVCVCVCVRARVCCVSVEFGFFGLEGYFSCLIG